MTLMTPYCSEAEADIYFSGRLNSDSWFEADEVEVLDDNVDYIRMRDADGNVYNAQILVDGGAPAFQISDGEPESGGVLTTRKYKALVTASEALNRLAYRGVKTDDSQVLEFPRNDDTEIPDEIKKACAEEALSLLQGRDPVRMMEEMRTKERAFDGARKSYDTTVIPVHIVAGITSGVAWDFLQPYLRDNRSIRIDRG